MPYVRWYRPTPLLYADLHSWDNSQLFSPSFHPANHFHTKLSQFEAFDMAHEVTDISDGKKRESCPTCQDLAFRDESWTPFRMPREARNIWKTNTSYESLRLSAQEGCPSCDLLYQFSKIVSKDIPDFRPELVTSKYGWWWEDSVLDIEMKHGDTTMMRSFHMYVTKGQSSHKKSYIYTGYQLRNYVDVNCTHSSFSEI